MNEIENFQAAPVTDPPHSWISSYLHQLQQNEKVGGQNNGSLPKTVTDEPYKSAIDGAGQVKLQDQNRSAVVDGSLQKKITEQTTGQMPDASNSHPVKDTPPPHPGPTPGKEQSITQHELLQARPLLSDGAGDTKWGSIRFPNAISPSEIQRLLNGKKWNSDATNPLPLPHLAIDGLSCQ
jgi:hypothetical protein